MLTWMKAIPRVCPTLSGREQEGAAAAGGGGGGLTSTTHGISESCTIDWKVCCWRLAVADSIGLCRLRTHKVTPNLAGRCLRAAQTSCEDRTCRTGCRTAAAAALVARRKIPFGRTCVSNGEGQPGTLGRLGTFAASCCQKGLRKPVQF
jgi:hypothetical protein